MGKINETLTLTDQFSASFHTFINLGNRAVETTQMLDKSLTNAMGKSAGAIIASIRNLGNQLERQNQTMVEIVQKQRRQKAEVDRTNSSAKQLLSTFRNIATATGATMLVKSFLDFSDTQTQITARLNLMNDGLQETAQLNEMIYQSAQRSRASYVSTADAIAKMGLNAGNAFSSNQELIAFMEAVNKQFAIGGGSAAAMEGAMVQLTQAMSSGALRGEELNSILDAAPGIARNIEQYMGWASGSIKQYAEDGEVTAEVVKNAMLSSADAINEQFNSIPMTLSQAMTQIRNEVQHSLQDAGSKWNDFINSADGQRILTQTINLFSILSQVGVDAMAFIGQGALWMIDNLDMAIPILGAVAVGYALVHKQAIAAGAASVKSGIVSAAAWAKTAVISTASAIKSGVAWAASGAINIASALRAAAEWRKAGMASIVSALKSAAAWLIANAPLILIIGLIGIVIGQIISLGITFQDVGAFIGSVLGVLYAVGYNIFASLWNVIATFAEFFANVFNDPAKAIAHLFFDLFDSVLRIVETVAGAIDTLLGTDISGAISGFRNQLSGWVDDTFGENAVQIKRMSTLDVAGTSQQWGEYGANLGSKLDNLSLSMDNLTGGLGDLSGLSNLGTGDALGDIGKVGSVGSVKNVEGSVNLSDEDLKIYRDLAERRYMNQIELKTLAPSVNVTLPAGAGGNLTAGDVADHIRKMLIQEMASSTAVSHG